VPTPAPAPAPQPAIPLEVKLGASGVEPSSASPGQEVAIWQELVSTIDANLLVDFELYDAQGQKVWQTWNDGQALSGGSAFVGRAAFTIDGLAPGDYVFKVGVFAAGWGTLFAWNDQAGALRIED
jgi:hypothetical protein